MPPGINCSANGRNSFALAVVVSIRSWRKRDVAIFRIVAFLWLAVRERVRPL